jgi:protein phosphatase
MGSDQNERPDFIEIEQLEGDIYLLCTDGLVGVVEEKKIIKSITTHGVSEETLSELKELTYKKGAPDNLTIIVATLSSKKSKSPGFVGAVQGGER